MRPYRVAELLRRGCNWWQVIVSLVSKNNSTTGITYDRSSSGVSPNMLFLYHFAQFFRHNGERYILTVFE